VPASRGVDSTCCRLLPRGFQFLEHLTAALDSLAKKATESIQFAQLAFEVAFT
jgi:hypothetical protein